MTVTASVIVACRNEKSQISRCLETILANDFPAQSLEVLVVDGMSTDGTREIVEDFARRHRTVRLIDNPKQITPAAFNIGVKESAGQVVLIMSAHARYAGDYIASSVRYLREHEADNVGGSMVTVPEGEGVLRRAVASVLSHPFGVGNARFRLRVRQPVWVDTVFGGCYRREVFEKIGCFNESLVRGWDMDFNTRLKRAGGRILLVPSIRAWYVPRGGLAGFARQNFRDGLWAIRAIPVAGRTFRVRHFVPLAFVSALLLGGAIGYLWAPVRLAVLGVAGLYAALALVSGIQCAVEAHDPRIAPVTPLLFALRHVSYGLGSLVGLCVSLFSSLAANVTKRERSTTASSC